MRPGRIQNCAGLALPFALLAGCGGGTPAASHGSGTGSGPPVSTPSATAPASGSQTATPGTPAPTATPGPGVLVAAPATLAFDTNGAGAAQTFEAIENGYSGTFAAATTNCANVASITGPSANGTFSVTPLAQGTCAYAISDSKNQHANVAISVTLTTATVADHGAGSRP